jgi:hypothetical protein
MFSSLLKKPFIQNNNCLKKFPFKNNINRNNYLTPYDSRSDFDSLIVKKPFSKNGFPTNENIIINIFCFLTLSTIMYYFYKPKK